MSGLAIKLRYSHHENDGPCRVCDLVQVLVMVEGFCDDVADLDAGGRVTKAINGAAMRAYCMAVEKWRNAENADTHERIAARLLDEHGVWAL